MSAMGLGRVETLCRRTDTAALARGHAISGFDYALIAAMSGRIPCSSRGSDYKASTCSAKQLRQLGGVGGDAPGLVARK